MSKSLIIYFSRADENYAVGYIDKGNTEIVAEYVQAQICSRSNRWFRMQRIIIPVSKRQSSVSATLRSRII